MSTWLENELDTHPKQCVSCTSKHPSAEYNVVYSEGTFTITGIGTVSLTLADIESTDFDFC